MFYSNSETTHNGLELRFHNKWASINPQVTFSGFPLSLGAATHQFITRADCRADCSVPWKVEGRRNEEGVLFLNGIAPPPRRGLHDSPDRINNASQRTVEAPQRGRLFILCVVVRFWLFHPPREEKERNWTVIFRLCGVGILIYAVAKETRVLSSWQLY